MASADLEKKRINTLNMVLACLTSTPDLLTIKQLQRDYACLVGEPLEYQKFGYSNLRDFLMDSPQYVKVERRGGTETVTPIITKDLERVNNLVQNQKHSKAKRGRVAIRRPVVTNTNNPPTQARSKKKPLLDNPVYNHPHQQKYPSSDNQQKRINAHSRMDNRRPASLKQNPSNAPSYHPQKQSRDYQQNYNKSYQKQTHTNHNAAMQRCGYSSSESNILDHRAPERIQSWPSSSSSSSNSLSPLPSKPKTARQLLEEAAAKKNIPIIFNGPVSCGSGWLWTLKLDGKLVTSFPIVSKTEQEGEDIVCEKALRSLQEAVIQEEKETVDLDVALGRIVKLVSVADRGLWLDSLESQYSEAYHEVIPSILISRAKEGPVGGFLLSRLSAEFDRWIAYVEDFECVYASDLIKKMDLIEPIVVLVTFVENCDNIAFRWLSGTGGKEQVDPYEHLVTEMELYYMDEKKQIHVPRPRINEFYNLNHDKTWSRVKVLQVKGDSAKVYFVDEGDEENVPIADLYQLDEKFLTQPFMSIHASLHELELVADHEPLLKELNDYVLGKSIFAKIVATEPNISVILYDTTTDEDININDKLMQIIPNNINRPLLPDIRLCEVYVTHVTDTGVIYVNIQNTKNSELNKIREKACQRAEELISSIQLTSVPGQKYLVRSTTTNDWQRAVPVRTNQTTQEAIVSMIDTGCMEMVSWKDMVPLEMINKIYAKIAPQAVGCNLQNVPPTGMKWTIACTERLKQIIKFRKSLIMKVLKDDSGSIEVELFKRIDEDSKELVSISASLAHDISLFEPQDSNNNKHENPKRPVALESTSLSWGSSVHASPLDSFAFKELPVKKLPAVNDMFDVIVSYASHPSNFVVQSYKTGIQLENLMADMQKFYKKDDNLTSVLSVALKGCYAMLHNDKLWYRVQITDGCESMFCGSFIDTGEVVPINKDQLQPLWPPFRKLPAQAMKAKLGGIVPKNADWAVEDTWRFKDLVEKKELVSQLVRISSDTDGSPVLNVSLWNTQLPNVDVCIEDILVKEGRAVKK